MHTDQWTPFSEQFSLVRNQAIDPVASGKGWLAASSELFRATFRYYAHPRNYFKASEKVTPGLWPTISQLPIAMYVNELCMILPLTGNCWQLDELSIYYYTDNMQ